MHQEKPKQLLGKNDIFPTASTLFNIKLLNCQLLFVLIKLNKIFKPLEFDSYFSFDDILGPVINALEPYE